MQWYRDSRRDLPWRRDVSPYHTLLSEFMLQQTRVETVIPYFHAFLARWPTLDALAEASEAEVLEAWAGLGYYRRAKLLLRAAKAASDRGGLPSDPSALRELPGIGPYTAGAVASIAFGVPAAAVDGNVERVLCRVDGLHVDPKSKAGRAALEARALELSAADCASEVTQGLMELGATCCTPRTPTCGACPWMSHCEAREGGLVHLLPKRAPKKPPRPESAVAVLAWRGTSLAVGRREPGLLGGMWEPLRGAGVEPAALLEAAGLTPTAPLRGVGEVVHVFTHRRLRCAVWEGTVEGRLCPPPGYDDVAWVDPARAEGWSRLGQKLYAAAAALTLPLAASPADPWES